MLYAEEEKLANENFEADKNRKTFGDLANKPLGSRRRLNHRLRPFYMVPYCCIASVKQLHTIAEKLILAATVDEKSAEKFKCNPSHPLLLPPNPPITRPA